MTLEEAIRIAEAERHSKVVAIGDCGDKWAFGFEDDIGLTDGIPIFVYKQDGSCEYFCVGAFMHLLTEGKITCKPVELPTHGGEQC